MYACVFTSKLGTGFGQIIPQINGIPTASANPRQKPFRISLPKTSQGDVVSTLFLSNLKAISAGLWKILLLTGRGAQAKYPTCGISVAAIFRNGSKAIGETTCCLFKEKKGEYDFSAVLAQNWHL